MEQGVMELRQGHSQTTWAWRMLEGPDCALSEAGVSGQMRAGWGPGLTFPLMDHSGRCAESRLGIREAVWMQEGSALGSRLGTLPVVSGGNSGCGGILDTF